MSTTPAEERFLDLSEYVAENNDSPELTAYKARVVRAADRLRNSGRIGGRDIRHIDTILKELGLSIDINTLNVKVTTGFGMVIVCEISPIEYANKSDDQIKADLAKKVSDKLAASGGTVELSGDQIISAEIIPPENIQKEGAWARNVYGRSGLYHLFPYLSHEGNFTQVPKCGSFQIERRDLIIQRGNEESVRCAHCRRMEVS